jgi:ankyrin repeat protein
VAHLLSRKLSYSHADMFGSSALHLAAANGHMEVCKVIVEAETNAMARYYATNFAFMTSKSGGNDSRLVNDQTKGEKNGIIALEISTKSDINAVSKEYSSLPRTAVDDVNSIASTSEIASIKRQRVLTNMTPRPCVLRAVDKRGRTAADVARICGHLFVSSFLKSAEVQGMKSIASYDPAHSHVQDDATLEPDDVADDLAYCFAKTLYFDPSYDSVFRDDETSDYNEHESDSSDLDTCSDCD